MKIIKKLTLVSAVASLMLLNTVSLVHANDDQKLTDADLQKIVDIYNSIQDNYIEDVDKDKLLLGALEGMVNALDDPYSEFLDNEEAKAFDDIVEGSFFGIGVQIMSESGQIVIISPIADTPAEKAGLLPNDIILEADGVVLTDMNTNEVVTYIRGEVGTTVDLKIQRGSSTFNVSIERAEIPIISVESELDPEDKTIGNVKITQFSITTADELEEAVKNLRDQGAKRFVFDLRNNPGGLLDQAIIISNMFLEDEETIVQTQEQDSKPVAYESSDAAYGKFQITEPYVVLINEGSASASEILSAAIAENTDNPLVGAKSFGKGTVQNITNQSDLGELKLTIAKWLTPTGLWIHKTGITPDVEANGHEIAHTVLLDTKSTLKLGDSNEFVKSAILVLRALGYDIESDFLYDESMVEAVKKFQTDNSLTVDGEITGDTAMQLNKKAREFLKENDLQYDKAVELLNKEN